MAKIFFKESDILKKVYVVIMGRIRILLDFFTLISRFYVLITLGGGREVGLHNLSEPAGADPTRW